MFCNITRSPYDTSKCDPSEGIIVGDLLPINLLLIPQQHIRSRSGFNLDALEKSKLVQQGNLKIVKA